MKLEQQVVSLELAKKLKELGVKQESSFYWLNEKVLVFKTGIGYTIETGAAFANPYIETQFSAFTVAELGEVINDCDFLKLGNLEWATVYRPHNHVIKDKNEADARARMLCYLLENQLINTESA